MAKKKTEPSPEIISEKKTSKAVKKSDVIEIHLDSIIPKIAASLPAIRKSSELKVQDPLTLYLKEISRHKLLTIEEEKELTLQLLETGDIDTAKKLVLANLRLVVKIALEYKNAYKNVMDLIQEGNIGLMKAVSKYDPAKGAKLSYYASW